MVRIRNLILCILLFSGLCKKEKKSSPIEFSKEKVKITLDTQGVFVEGIYWFKNPSSRPVKFQVYYPFPVDSSHLYPDFIQVGDFPFVKSDSGVYFTMELEPNQEVPFEVRYRQKIKESSVRYILTTLQKWGKPIKRADFIVILPKDFKKVKFSYSPDSMSEEGKKRYYFITKQDFMADRDLWVRW